MERERWRKYLEDSYSKARNERQKSWFVPNDTSVKFNSPVHRSWNTLWKSRSRAALSSALREHLIRYRTPGYKRTARFYL